jgi:hypothetical protein
MAKTTALLIALGLLSVSPIALAFVEYDYAFSYGGEASIIPREPNYYEAQEKSAVEIECNSEAGSAHLVMGADEARDFAESINAAALEAEGLSGQI